MVARIYKPAKTAMQSGTAKTREWVLDYEPEQPRAVEPLMGWTSSGDMRQQVRLRFETQEEAVAYCERHGIPYQVAEPKPAERKPCPIRTISPSRGAAPGRTEPAFASDELSHPPHGGTRSAGHPPSGGSPDRRVRQRSSARGQRGAKRQPERQVVAGSAARPPARNHR